jgi:hypothetical protein
MGAPEMHPELLGVRLPPITFPSFRKMAESHLSSYFETVSQGVQAGTISFEKDEIPLFPTTAVFTRSPTHYVVELFGARRRCGTLRSKLHTARSFSLIMEDFEYNGPTAYLLRPQPTSGPRRPSGFTNIAFVAQRTLHELEERFPGLRGLFKTSIVFTPEDVECIKWLDATPDLNYPIIISNCLVVNSLGNIVRARYINLFLVIPAELETQEVINALRETVRVQSDLPGVQIVNQGHQEAVAQAGQLANLYLQGVHETTLTQFLEDHSEIIQRALDADQIFFQPLLAWREGNPDPTEIAIQPDIIMRRNDGQWYIIDFKLPLLTKASITTGGHKRRRFIYTVADGVAQLHNYRVFFEHQANREAAVSTLGEEICDAQLMLIAGTSENVDLAEVDEAMRPLKPIEIVDYDTLIRMSVTKLNH